MLSRFEAVGMRFDGQDEQLSRLVREVHELRSDVLRLENGVLNAEQNALRANLRIDDPDGGPAGLP
jgi:outer membrane murein-binding lipoprotein Lpp